MMERREERLVPKPIKGGWAVRGDGWAVHGETEAEALRLYHEAIVKHKEIDARPVGTGEDEVSRHDD